MLWYIGFDAMLWVDLGQSREVGLDLGTSLELPSTIYRSLQTVK